MSVLSRGADLKDGVNRQYGQLSQMEQSRNNANAQIKAGRKAQMVGNTAQGAAIGASVGGPVGAVVGGGIGLLTSFL